MEPQQSRVDVRNGRPPSDGRSMEGALRRFRSRVTAPVAAMRLGDTGVLPSFDLTTDGSVVALVPTEEADHVPDRITVLVSFFDELERRLPAVRP